MLDIPLDSWRESGDEPQGVLFGRLEAGVGRQAGGGFPSFGGDAVDLGLDVRVSGGGGSGELGMGPVARGRRRGCHGLGWVAFLLVMGNWRLLGMGFGDRLGLVVFPTVFLVSRSMPYLSLASLAEIPTVPSNWLKAGKAVEGNLGVFRVQQHSVVFRDNDQAADHGGVGWCPAENERDGGRIG